MKPEVFADTKPEHPAIIMAATGQVITYREMESAANQFARLLRDRGLRRGDHLAVMLDNDPHYLEVVWGALRSGLYVTPINWHLGADEAGYILRDCGASALVSSNRLAAVTSSEDAGGLRTRLSVDDPVEGFESYLEALAGYDESPLDDESLGAVMFYSSGTTGRPKGIKAPLSDESYGDASGLAPLLTWLYGFTEDTRYLVPAPLYHAAPLVWSVGAHRLGATVVVMDRFDAVEVLADVERYRVTHAQFVPTHFIRLLRIPDEQRRYDLSSMSTVIHAAAPCPVEVKRAMIEWWGPIIFEYYAGSEGVAWCAATSEEWLEHPGTVGRPIIGIVHVLGEDGAELSTGEVGQLWFESGVVFEYHNDPEKTAAAFNEQGWSTLGDVGYLDDDGYVYLTDRVSHTIISGGVNIYPQEVENVLAMHPAVVDVAVFGVPDDEFGEAVKAVVQLTPGYVGDDECASAIISYCRERLAGFKCPRSVDFVDELPRLPSGKLLKRKLRQLYWPA